MQSALSLTPGFDTDSSASRVVQSAPRHATRAREQALGSLRLTSFDYIGFTNLSHSLQFDTWLMIGEMVSAVAAAPPVR